MPNLLTPKRRQLKRSAAKFIDDLVENWERQTGSYSGNGHMGMRIRAGGLRRFLRAYAERHDVFATGTHEISIGPPYHITPFRVDVDALIAHSGHPSVASPSKSP